MGKADLPKEVMQAVSHEAERRDFLLARNFRHVLPQLFFSLARIPSRSFCLNDCKDGAVRVVEAEIREPILGRRVIAFDGNLELDLGVVGKVPSRALKQRVNKEGSRLRFSEVHDLGLKKLRVRTRVFNPRKRDRALV